MRIDCRIHVFLFLCYGHTNNYKILFQCYVIESIIIRANKHKGMEFTMTLGNVKLNHTKTISIKR